MTQVTPVRAALPVDEALPALLAALMRGNAVLVAPPGAGKTTTVPLALLDAPWLGGQRIVMLEPRRLATRAAAARMAGLLGERTGQTVGFRTRLESIVSAATRIEIVTEGILVRRLHGDPGLDGVGCVILDEVHERSLDADLALALCRDLQRQLRPELRLLAMSATADAERLAPLLDASVVTSPGRMYPVGIEHAARDLAQPRDLPEALARAVRDALGRHDGDILAFLPGMAEIRRAEAALAGCGAAVLALHGDLPPAHQDVALRPDPGGRRVVLATSIAETSLTVPGIRVVVDGGFRRAPSVDAATGLPRLVTRRISRAAAEQRAGRAGREAPGVAIRLWTASLHRGLPAFDPPEILSADLAGLVLDCAVWGTAPEALPFPDQPPSGALATARALLISLDALTPGDAATARGRHMAGLGAHPRLAAMMLAAADPSEAALAADLAALLEERDPLRGSEASADIALRLAALAGQGAADRGVVSRIRAASAQFRRRLHLGAQAPAGDPARLLAAAFPDRIAQRRGEPGSFRLSGGGGARLPLTDPLSRAPLLAVASLELRQGAHIRLAAPLDLAALPDAVAAQVTETVETGIDPATGTALARRRRRLGALVLEDRTEALPAAEAAALVLTSIAMTDLPWSEAARGLQARAAHMRTLEPQVWPDLSDAALSADRAWLAPHVVGLRGRADLARLDLPRLLRGVLGPLAARLDRELPPDLMLPGGRAAIDYAADVPTVSSRAQNFFGMTATPALAGGRIKLRLALLSPAGRPVAITADLTQFWTAGWADVLRDMRGRYPRHHWPDDPAHASPTRPR